MSITRDDLRNYLSLSYEELKTFNLEIKREKESGKHQKHFEEKVLNFLSNEKGIKAITVAFSDLNGRLQVLDYDCDFFQGSYKNLTFDGSSVSGFTTLGSSDLRLSVDFGSFRLLPSDIFGAGKAFVFANVKDKDGSLFESDFRGRLSEMLDQIRETDGMRVLMAPEIEGFLLEGVDAEQHYYEEEGFEKVSNGGYFNALPQDELRVFIDTVAEVERALGFENEKDHGEVAPSQFEINFKYSDALITCDQILMYKLIARQVAKSMGYTATFLPKPIAGINGNGMHSNLSIEKEGKNLFYKEGGEDGLSPMAQDFITGVLYYAPDMCGVICSSINAYRRLDPNYEAPNEIKKSACDRGSMIRIPLANEKSARIEVRSVSPDSNPYLAYFIIIEAGLRAVNAEKEEKTEMEKTISSRSTRKLFPTFHQALPRLKSSSFMKEVMKEETHKKYVEIKQELLDRSPKLLGDKVKRGEVIHHHEVYNQVLWSDF